MSDGLACARSGPFGDMQSTCVESGQGLWTFSPSRSGRKTPAMPPSWGKSENNFTTKLAQLGSCSRGEWKLFTSNWTYRVLGPCVSNLGTDVDEASHTPLPPCGGKCPVCCCCCFAGLLVPLLLEVFTIFMALINLDERVGRKKIVKTWPDLQMLLGKWRWPVLVL